MESGVLEMRKYSQIFLGSAMQTSRTFHETNLSLKYNYKEWYCLIKKVTQSSRWRFYSGRNMRSLSSTFVAGIYQSTEWWYICCRYLPVYWMVVYFNSSCVVWKMRSSRIIYIYIYSNTRYILYISRAVMIIYLCLLRYKVHILS